MPEPEPPFATLHDLEARGIREASTAPGYDPSKVIYQALLEDASDKIMSDVPHWRECSPATLRRIVCQMVRRASVLATGDTTAQPAGVTQMSQTVGPFNMSRTFSNPDGDLYLTSQELKSLGVGVQAMGCIMLGG